MTPLGPWLPDQPDYRDPSLIEAKNLTPREDGSYGPFFGCVTTSAPLPDRAIALAASRTTAGDQQIFAATASQIYRFATDGSFTAVGRPGGYSLDMASGERPEFGQFGDDFVAAMGLGNPLQVFNLDGGSAFSDLSADAPNAKHLAIVNEFTMVGNTYQASQGERPDQVWWAAAGDPSSWPAIGTAAAATVRSDRQVMADGGHIQGILAGIGGTAAAIFGEKRIWRADAIGAPLVFQFTPVVLGRGVYSPGSLVGDGTTAYFLAEDGWYAFDGTNCVSIGNGIDRYFLADLDDNYREWIYGAADVAGKVIYWAYPGAGNLGGIPNKWLMYNKISGRWARGELEVDAIGQLVSQGYTLEGLDVFGPLDTLPYSLDSRIYAGGGSFVGMVRASDHRLGQFGDSSNQSALQADWTASEVSGPVGSRVWISGMKIYTNAPSVSGAIAWRDSGSGEPIPTPYVQQDEDFIDHLVACRFARAKGRIPAGTAWTQVQGYDFDMRQEGRR